MNEPVSYTHLVQHLAVHVLEALVARVSLQEMLHQQGDVRLALPQRREMDGDVYKRQPLPYHLATSP